ncbi:MAG: hypothetical protein EBZ50_15795, partial [Alphaproteobacteria bacterium]|nr:hypothetical protein [Alphaproteobacteria bacterium]
RLIAVVVDRLLAEDHDLRLFGVDVTPRLKVVKVTEPPKRQGGVKVKTVQELVDKLKNEAGVL